MWNYLYVVTNEPRTYILVANIRYLAYDGWRNEPYAETVEAENETDARIIGGSLIASGLSAGESLEITSVSER